MTSQVAKQAPWPKQLSEQLRHVRGALELSSALDISAEVTKAFSGAKTDKVAELWDALAAMGQARVMDGGKYAA
jgi:hypothetical protein